MFELLATIVSGGATGIIGSVVGGAFKWLDRREQAKADAAKREHEIRLQRLNIEAGQKETESELRVIEAEASRDALLASYQHDAPAGQTSPWANNVKTMVRPTLTFVLIALTAAIYFTLDDGLGNAAALKEYIINTIVYTTSAAVLWWFGDRAMRVK